jgi:hypothetical protein
MTCSGERRLDRDRPAGGRPAQLAS